MGAFLAKGKYAAWRKPELRLTVDVSEDLALVREIFGALYASNPAFSTGEAIGLVDSSPNLKALNSHVRQRIASEQWRDHV